MSNTALPGQEAYCAAEAAGDLRTCIHRPFLPGKASEQAIGESDGRIEVTTCTSSNIYPKHDSKAPSVLLLSSAYGFQ